MEKEGWHFLTGSEKNGDGKTTFLLRSLLFLLPEGGLELVVVGVAPGIDLLALGEASLAANKGGEVKLDGVLGDIDDLAGAEEHVDALLSLVEGGESLGVDLAHKLLGAVTLILKSGLVDQGGDVLNRDGGAAIAALALPGATPAAAGEEETEASQGLDTDGSGQEASGGDADSTGEDGLSLGAQEGQDGQAGSGDDDEVHG